MGLRVSFICSIFKEDNSFLELFLKTVSEQTYKDFEVIMIDDGATDENLSLIRSFNDPRIKVIKNSRNIGLTKSLNIASKLARGEYLARLDTDDFISPDRLEKQVEFLDSHPDHVLCGSHGYEIDGTKRDLQKNFPLIESDSDLRKSVVLFNPFIHSSIMMRKEAFSKIGGYNESFRYSQDYQLVFQLMKVGKVANLPQPLVSRHVGGHQISIKKQASQTYYALRTKIQCLWFFGLNMKGLFSIFKSSTKLILLTFFGYSALSFVRNVFKVSRQ